MELQGFHHLTAVTANARGNLQFYTKTLGMRLVKKTVNQDDTSAYHLFYADGAGSPGTDITFFDWPAAREKRGTSSIVRTGFRVASQQALEFWDKRLHDNSAHCESIRMESGRATLPFEDPEGQRLAIVVDAGASPHHPWNRTDVPPEFQIIGLGPITISVPELASTADVLTRVMNMRDVTPEGSQPGSEPDVEGELRVFRMGPGGPSAELHVLVEPQLPQARGGAGGVHHVAFRVPTFEQYDEWNTRLKQLRIPSSGPVDRFYFRSLYFREPNGILFELATDGPGFHADEPFETMGERLSLPPFLESRRAVIEAGLKPLHD